VIKLDDACNLPEELATSIKLDDHYLVRAQLSVSGSVLVTTDAPLREIVTGRGLPCLSRKEFLARLSIPEEEEGIAAGGTACA
jgi:hypothetical protein